MPPRIVSSVLDERGLRDALTEFRTSMTTVYLESETRVVLAPLSNFLGPRITLPPVRWLVGRAFGPTLELRWYLDGSQFNVSALSEAGIGPQHWLESGWNSLLDPEALPRNVLLAGLNANALPVDHALYRFQNGLWVDPDLPRPLSYPGVDPQAERVMLRCLDYTVRGLVVITRLCELALYQQ